MMLFDYKRSIALALLVAGCFWFALSDLRLDTWNALLPFFEWMETTPFGVMGKTWGAVFAVVQAFHLLSLAVLGGAVIVGDGRLLGVMMRDTPIATVQEHCHRLLLWSLAVIIFTGIFMACGVALKVYYLNVFWYKMLALFVGVVFTFAVRRPLLLRAGDETSPLLLKLVGIASLMIWFSVAATGRWIGFSG